MILQKHVLSFKCNDFLKMANLKAISSSATLIMNNPAKLGDNYVCRCPCPINCNIFVIYIKVYHCLLPTALDAPCFVNIGRLRGFVLFHKYRHIKGFLFQIEPEAHVWVYVVHPSLAIVYVICVNNINDLGLKPREAHKCIQNLVDLLVIIDLQVTQIRKYIYWICNISV